jgi:hypothetical protein
MQAGATRRLARLCALVASAPAASTLHVRPLRVYCLHYWNTVQNVPHTLSFDQHTEHSTVTAVVTDSTEGPDERYLVVIPVIE